MTMSVYKAELFDEVKELPKATRIAIVVADFNDDITHSLAQKTKERLNQEGFLNNDIFRVPGMLELPAMTHLVTEKGIYGLCIIIGCVIKGETPDFEYVFQSTSNALTTLSVKCQTPLIIGLLMDDTLEQTKERINDNYAIYGLNYLVQWASGEHVVETRYQEIMESVGSALKDIPNNK